MNIFPRLLLLCTFGSLCSLHAMDNNNNNNNNNNYDPARDNQSSGKISAVERRTARADTPTLMRASRALLSQRDRERTLEELEPGGILIHNAKTLASEARKLRSVLIDTTENLNRKITLLTAEENIKRQIKVIQETKDQEKKEAINQLHVFMSEAFIAIDAEKRHDAQDHQNAGVARINVSSESDEEEADLNTALVDVETTLASIERNLEKVKRDLEKRDLDQPPLSPRAQKLGRLFADLPVELEANPHRTYEICRERIQEHSALLLSKLRDENNAALHQSMAHITAGQIQDYIPFTIILACGVDRSLVYHGQTLLDAAVASGNDMLVQLLTTEYPNKETLVTLALEHDKQELLHYLLE